mmetsp:Transcript_28207/g.76316  ORF Transcript_28207/g.76316 Transcript_28207/m.76316 type:complete len:243 (+) Transcript_28207:212-940(+)
MQHPTEVHPLARPTYSHVSTRKPNPHPPSLISLSDPTPGSRSVEIRREHVAADDETGRRRHVRLLGELRGDLGGVGHRELGLHEGGAGVCQPAAPAAAAVERLHVLHGRAHVLDARHAAGDRVVKRHGHGHVLTRVALGCLDAKPAPAVDHRAAAHARGVGAADRTGRSSGSRAPAAAHHRRAGRRARHRHRHRRRRRARHRHRWRRRARLQRLQLNVHRRVAQVLVLILVIILAIGILNVG